MGWFALMSDGEEDVIESVSESDSFEADGGDDSFIIVGVLLNELDEFGCVDAEIGCWDL